MTDSPSSDLLINFRLQRRNLIAISAALIFLQSAGAEITKLSLLGNELTIKSQDNVHFVLWACWAYWGIRYYAYFREIGDKGWRLKYADKMRDLLPKIALKKYFLSVGLDALRRKDTVVSITGTHYEQCGPDWVLAVNYQLYKSDNPNSHSITHSSSGMMKLSGRELWKPQLSACMHIALNTRLLSEYVFPYVFALLPAAQYFLAT